MGLRNRPLVYELVEFPWWGLLISSAVVYVLGKWVLPPILIASSAHSKSIIPLGPAFASALSVLAPLLAFLLTGLAIISAIKQQLNKRLLDAQTGIDSIRAMHWAAFEALVGEIYRRQGYSVKETGGGGADGGVDLLLDKNGEHILVQCKHWQAFSVGAPIIREMYGLTTAEHASKGIIVTSGHFTEDAVAFARGKNLELIDGELLTGMVKSLKSGEPCNPNRQLREVAPASSAPPRCPKCGKPMALRTAHSGPHAGSKFWGCTGYPACRTIKNI